MDMYPFEPSNPAHAVMEPPPADPLGRLWIAMGTAAVAEHMISEARDTFKEACPLIGHSADQVNFMLSGCSAVLRELYAQMAAARQEAVEKLR